MHSTPSRQISELLRPPRIRSPSHGTCDMSSQRWHFGHSRAPRVCQCASGTCPGDHVELHPPVGLASGCQAYPAARAYRLRPMTTCPPWWAYALPAMLPTDMLFVGGLARTVRYRTPRYTVQARFIQHGHGIWCDGAAAEAHTSGQHCNSCGTRLEPSVGKRAYQRDRLPTRHLQQKAFGRRSRSWRECWTQALQGGVVGRAVQCRAPKRDLPTRTGLGSGGGPKFFKHTGARGS